MQVYRLRNAIHTAWFQQRIAKHAWENWIPAAIAPARHDRERQWCKRTDSALRAAAEHCVASCATFACARIQRTNGWVCASLRLYVVCCVLCVFCMLCRCLLLLLCVSCVMRVVCVRGPACCVVCVSCLLCVRCPLVSYMLRVRCHACRTCRARFHNVADNAPMTYRTKR